MSFSKRSTLSKNRTKEVPLSQSTTNLSKNRNSTETNSLAGTMRKRSDMDLTISSFVQIPLGNVKLTTSYIYPDYEEELSGKRNIIERDKLKSLLLFPSDDIELKKIKKDEVFEWYSIYGAKDIKYINVLGRKTIEILSAKRQNFVVTSNYEDYNGPFFTLPKFVPTSEPLYRHEYSKINTSTSDTDRPRTTHQPAESDEVLYRGYLEIYAPYIESNLTIEKWITSVSPKKRFFSLNRPAGQNYYRLEYKKEDNEKLKYKGVFFLEYCLCFRQSNVKPFSFEMHINQKIIIFVASSAKEFNNWVKSLSDATGLALERERDSKFTSVQKRTTIVQETWGASGIPILCEYSKESDAMNQKLRSEKRYKLYNLHTNIIWFNENTNVDADSIYVVGEKQGRRLFFEFLGIEMRVSYVEPFVLTFSIYDLKEKCKISEDFVCDPAEPALLQYLKFNQEFTDYHNVINGNGKYLEGKRMNKFFHDFQTTHDDIYLVLQVSKIYTCKLNTLWEYYQKGGSKTEAKLGKGFLETATEVKKYTMPVGFSFKRLFYRGELDDETNFHTLMKHDYKLSSADLIKYIEEYKNDPKQKSICVNFEMNYKISLDKIPYESYNLLSSSYEALKPLKPNELKIYRELQNIPTNKVKFYGYPSPMNLLFVNCQNLNFANIKSSIKTKNVVITLEIYDHQKTSDSEKLSLIFSKSCQPGFIKISSTNVICDCISPNLLDEFKILLPAVIMPDLHILFLIHSVSYKEKDDGKKKKSSDDVIGYCWIKLFKSDQILENKEYNLPIVTHLPENYLKYELESADRSKSLVDLKWIDGVGRELFKFNLTFVTNYFTDNDHLQKLMSFVDEKGVTSDTCSQLAALIKWLNSIGSCVMIIHLNAILNLLFEIIQKSSKFKSDMKNKADDLQNNVVRIMLFIGAEVCRKQRADLLRGYVKYIFNPDVNPLTENIHDIILKHLASSINYGSDPIMTENFYLCCFFFLDILAKSISIYAITSNRIIKNRKNLLKASTIDGLGELVGLIMCLVQQKYSLFPIGAKNLNRYFSKFLTRCFSFLDRGLVFKYFSIVVENFLGDDQKDVSLRFDTLTQLANYENFVPLNLPIESPGNKIVMKHLQELSVQYAINHFPLWLILSQVKDVLNLSYECRKYGIRLMRNLLIKHHFDDRYNGNDEMMCRIHILYLPFITILMEKLDIFEESTAGNILDLSADNISISDMQGSVKGDTSNKKKWTTAIKPAKDPLFSDMKIYSNEHGKILYTKKDLCEIMMMFLQIISSIDLTVAMDYIKSFCTNVASTSSSSYTPYDTKKSKNTTFAENFLSMLKISLSLFEYQPTSGKSKNSMFATMHSLKSPRLDSSTKAYTSFINGHKTEMDSNLFYEVCMVVLDYIEKIYTSFKTVIESELGDNNMMKLFFSVHLFLLQATVPLIVRKHHFSLLRQFVSKSSQVLFKGSNKYCYTLCIELLKLTSCDIEGIRKEAQLLIYLILRSDYCFSGLLYHRSYIAIIMACSTVVEQSMCFNFLFDTMKELWNLVKSDEAMKNSEFSSEISDLTKRVKNIIRLTVRFKELETNPESLVDAHCSIFNSFTGVPELQQTWLERIAFIQTRHGNHSEAAMCYVEIAALIALTLKRNKILPDGYLVFEAITPNINPNEFTFKEDALTDENLHTLEAFIINIKKASDSFIKAERYEIIRPLSKIICPFFENDANYEELSQLHGKLKTTYDKIITSIQKRFLGTYYRVAFYGRSFKEDHYCQFIYKEPKLSQIIEVIDRLRAIHEPYCVDLSIINDSNKVKCGELDPKKDYIQINAVKQIFKITTNQEIAFLSHNNVGIFELETPFTKSGKAQGSVGDQWKRKTTFTTSKCFPDIKKRIPIIKSQINEFSPIEVAIDEMKTQVKDLSFFVDQKPSDMIGLQLKLQGSVSVTVNAGPLAYANTFLKQDVRKSLPAAYTTELESIFRDFIEICGKALALNGELISDNQIEYHKDLSDKFSILKTDIDELLAVDGKKI